MNESISFAIKVTMFTPDLICFTPKPIVYAWRYIIQCRSGPRLTKVVSEQFL